MHFSPMLVYGPIRTLSPMVVPLPIATGPITLVFLPSVMEPPRLDRSLDLRPVHGEVADDVREFDILQFPPLCLPEGVRAADIGPVAPGKPAFQGMALPHQIGEEVAGEIIF